MQRRYRAGIAVRYRRSREYANTRVEVRRNPVKPPLMMLYVAAEMHAIGFAVPELPKLFGFQDRGSPSGSTMQLLLKDDRLSERIIVDEADDERTDIFSGIRCPHCGWRPSDESRWACDWHDETPEPRFESCGTVWNTFGTRGRCPVCGHQWQWTSCLRCGQWSPHEDWYEHQPTPF
jgi:hypothetical protein